YSMLKIPDKSEFPVGKIATQNEWLNVARTNGCITCHQLGNKATRTIPKELGHFNSSAEAWQRRIVSGQAMTTMVTRINEMGANKATGARSEYSLRKDGPAIAVALLGSRTDMG